MALVLGMDGHLGRAACTRAGGTYSGDASDYFRQRHLSGVITTFGFDVKL